MSTAVYSFSFVVSFVLLFILVLQYYKKISAYYVMLFASIMFFCFGYLLLTQSTNLDMAIGSQLTIYLGSAFTPFFTMMCMADLCNFSVKKWKQILFVIWGAVIFMGASTIHSTDWYYRNVSFVVDNGIGMLLKDYGPMHLLYPVYLITCTVATMVMIIKSFRTKRQVSLLSSVSMLVLMVMTVVVYTLERIFHVDLEYMPFVYNFCEIIILILLGRIVIYNVASVTADNLVDSQEYGFALFDARGVYIGSDDTAKGWFPELYSLRIDRKIGEANTDFLTQAVKWIEGVDKNKECFFERNDTIVKAEYVVTTTIRGSKLHCINLLDDTKQQKYAKLMEDYNETLSTAVAQKTEKIKAMSSDMLVDMALIVDSRDGNTGGHIQRTSDVVEIFMRHLQEKYKFSSATLSPKFINSVLKAAILHDFGKIAVSDLILNKPGKFTDEEYEIMKTHAARGAELVGEMIKHMDDELFKEVACNIAHYHHEKWDGTGYPTGISGADIPMEARIMALADVFDALVSKRVYKERMSYDDAFRIIAESSGTHFDPELCGEFLECREKIEALYNSYPDDVDE